MIKIEAILRELMRLYPEGQKLLKAKEGKNETEAHMEKRLFWETVQATLKEFANPNAKDHWSVLKRVEHMEKQHKILERNFETLDNKVDNLSTDPRVQQVITALADTFQARDAKERHERPDYGDPDY